MKLSTGRIISILAPRYNPSCQSVVAGYASLLHGAVDPQGAWIHGSSDVQPCVQQIPGTGIAHTHVYTQLIGYFVPNFLLN